MIKSLNIKSRQQCGDTTWNKLQSALYRQLYKHGIFGGYIINLPNSTDWDAKQEDAKKAVYDLCLDIFKAINQADNDVVFQQEIAHGRRRFLKYDQKFKTQVQMLPPTTLSKYIILEVTESILSDTNCRDSESPSSDTYEDDQDLHF